MATFPFELVSPERLLISREVQAVSLPGSEGDFEVMANHAPLLALLGPGIMNVTYEGSETDSLFIDGGFCDVTPAGCTVLAEAAVPVAELTAERMDGLIAESEENAASLEVAADRDEANRRIATLRMVRAGL